MSVTGVRFFLLWMVFLATTRLTFFPPISIELLLSIHGEIFPIKKLPFGLKTICATFQRAMYYAFHDIKPIVQSYLDNLPAHSTERRVILATFK